MTSIKIFERPKLKNPLLLVGLPGVGNIGRVAIGYLVSELKAKKFASMYSEWFFPFVMLQDKSTIKLLKNDFHYHKAKKAGERDIIFLVGDCQSLSPNGHYDVIEQTLDFVEKFGVKDIITVGGLATGELESNEKVLGCVTDSSVSKKYSKYGIGFIAGEKVGYIVGAAGLMLGIGYERGMAGLCMLGQTSGFPIVTDPKAAEHVLDTLVNILKIKIDKSKLEKKVNEMEEFIKKVEGLQVKAVSELAKSAKSQSGEELRYIG